MPEETHSPDPSVPQHDPGKTRKQLWTVFLFLLLAALGLTGYRWYHANQVAAVNEIPWQNIKWEVAKPELERGRRMLLVVYDESDSGSLEDHLAKYETKEIRKHVYLSGRLPVKLAVQPDSELFQAIAEEFQISELPCGIVTHGKQTATILDGGMNSETIAGTMKESEYP